MNPEPKVVVAAGAAGGIGRALAVDFAGDGAAVVAFGRDANRLAETAGSVPDGRVTRVAGSVASEATSRDSSTRPCASTAGSTS